MTTDRTARHDDADRALKAKHRAMWALGDYPAVATEIIPRAGRDPGRGRAASSPATGCWTSRRARATPPSRPRSPGASVVASDLTPELFEVGRRRRRGRGAELEWREADAEALPFADGEFDTVLSCVGVMFAPHHQASADELVRVCRPGGTIGLLELDAGGLHRPDVRDDEAVRAPAAARRAARRRCGATRTTSARCSATGSPTSRRAGAVDGRPLRPPGGLPRLLQGQLRPDHRGLQEHRRRPGRRSRRWTRELAELARRFDHGDGSTGRWTGSTCC